MNDYAYKHHGMAQPIPEPRPWRYDGDHKRREPVIDPNDNRVIRHVGYRKCMSCPKHFWSEDVVKLRICPVCKQYKSD
jgi:hypothetical protein